MQILYCIFSIVDFVFSNKSFINVEAQAQDPNSVLSFYKKMIEFRKNSSAIVEGNYRKVAAPTDVYIFTRESEGQRLYIYCNLSGTGKAVEFYGDKIVFGNYDEEEREEFYLKPYEFRIVQSNI